MAIVGVNIFKKNCYVNNFSEYISKSDEAMAFLILANNWDVWCEVAEDLKKQNETTPQGNKEKKPIEKCESKQRYHIDGKGRGYSWSALGKQYYNTMYDKIDMDRRMEHSKDFDEFFINHMIKRESATAQERNQKRKKQEHPHTEIRNVRCRNDFIDNENTEIFEL